MVTLYENLQEQLAQKKDEDYMKEKESWARRLKFPAFIKIDELTKLNEHARIMKRKTVAYENIYCQW